MIPGSCLCGAVAFELEGPLDLMTHCHCGRCRKAHGTEFATYVGARPEGFRVTRGAEEIRRHASSPGHVRSFCGRCGSVVPGEPAPGEARAFVPAGLLDADPGARPIAHIFAASRAPWVELDPSIPAFDAWPPGYEAAVVDPPDPGEAVPGVLRGSCLCGGVRFHIEGTPQAMRHCHCSRCRKSRTAACATNLMVDADAVRMLSGEEGVGSYAVPGARFFRHVFCRTCGSPLPRIDRERGVAVVPAGALDDAPGLAPSAHIFVASGAPWYRIVDDLPQHAERPE